MQAFRKLKTGSRFLNLAVPDSIDLRREENEYQLGRDIILDSESERTLIGLPLHDEQIAFSQQKHVQKRTLFHGLLFLPEPQ
jgi:hypothetical protein